MLHPTRARCLILVAALGLHALWGCPDNAPERAFDVFYRALQRGDVDTAWASLSQRTRTALEGVVARATPPGAVSRPAQQVLFEQGMLAPMREILSVQVLNRAGEQATLQVEDEAEQKQQITMVLEQGEWRVVLPVPESGA